MDPRPPKLLDQACPELERRIRDALRDQDYAYSTEQTYVDWIKRYIIFHGKRHPREMGGSETVS